MEKERNAGQKQDQHTPQDVEAAKQASKLMQTAADSSSTQPHRRNKKAGSSRIGGKAVSGAKSTLPKQVSVSNDPQQQEVDNYNREMRRRMQRLHVGPYSEKKGETPQEKRRKRIERRKQRLEEERAHLRRNVPKSQTRLGRGSIYFILAVLVIIIALVAIFLILRR